MNDYSIALHEASHAACARVLNRDVDHVWREVGTVLAGETAGFASVPIGERIEASQVPVVLIGYMSTDTEGWPPSYENALVEKREALGAVLVLLDIDEKQCREYVEFTCDLLADEEFVRFRDSIARALMTVPRIESATIERLAEIHFDSEPEGEMAWST